MKPFYFSFFILFFLFGCYSTPEIPGFDRDSWNKPATCNDDKLKIAEMILSHADKLHGKGEIEIKKLLGNPQEHELYARNQKFFYYYLYQSDCSSFKKLSFRFNALDQVKEVSIME